jgi:hypothetical protein
MTRFIVYNTFTWEIQRGGACKEADIPLQARAGERAVASDDEYDDEVDRFNPTTEHVEPDPGARNARDLAKAAKAAAKTLRKGRVKNDPLKKKLIDDDVQDMDDVKEILKRLIP